ncbi:MAG: D-alanine--D-alanine ligase [Erysipelotrichales bacterium]|nr:D-alanine--D-alanine ligase [Erysipelotrichales bacterium]
MKIKVGVMFGGESVEHEISVITAAQAMAAIDREKYDVYPIYISKNRQFYSSDALLNMDTYKDLAKLEKTVPQVFFYRNKNDFMMADVTKKLFNNKEIKLDVVLPIMHGTNGEDGSLQGYLETLKVPYGGSDVYASAVGQDKVLMKHILSDYGLPITPWFWLYSYDFNQSREKYIQKAEELGYPVIIKPACLGSSIGIYTAHNEEEFIHAINESSMYDRKLVVEKMITHLKEVNASVLGNSAKQRVSVLEEVTKSGDILSFEQKYMGNGGGKNGSKGTPSKSAGMASASRIIPANISAEDEALVKQYAKETFKVLGSSGVCRIDFMQDMDSGKIYVNEINSIPGSLAFYLWDKSGINFTELMDALIKLAIDRKREQEKMVVSFDSNVLTHFGKGAKGAKGAKS